MTWTIALMNGGLFLHADGRNFAADRQCGFDEALQTTMRNPHMQFTKVVADERITQEQRRIEALGISVKRISAPIRTIPVVIHIMHNDGPENISDEQILSQMDAVNEDFRKMQDTPGFGDGVDTEIQFCLAGRNPDGRCTDGIVRVQTPLTEHQTYQRPDLSRLSYWDAERYLNIYVVKSIASGAAGYASFPGQPPEADGIVIRSDFFGRTGTARGSGRTLTHEIGHWLGLYHTFQDGCGDDPCNDGDKVCDTPPQNQPHSGCPAESNTCSNDDPDLPDPIHNYMDYTDDNCRNMFTTGQAARMNATLNTVRTQIWTDENVVAAGCAEGDVRPDCDVIADFMAWQTEICAGNTVQFFDRSQNGSQTRRWLFPGGSPASSFERNPHVTYSEPGVYSVTMISSDVISEDTLIRSDYISVTQQNPGVILPFAQNFESIIFPPEGIDVHNPDRGIGWERDTLAASSGKASIRINNLLNVNFGQVDEFTLPDLDLRSMNADELSLRFYWAYARAEELFSDEFSVHISTDCGVSFDRIFYRIGGGLATAPTQADPFIPTKEQWRMASISLDDYRESSAATIKFVNVTDGGNNLYVDDIRIGSPATGLEEFQVDTGAQLSIFPNPGQTASASFVLESAGNISLDVFSVLGERVAHYPLGIMASGSHNVQLNPGYWSGAAAQGVYLISLKTGKATASALFIRR